MRAFSGYTRRRPERTHGGVLNLHTEGFSAFSSLFSSLFLFILSLALFPLLSSLSSLSATMTMITRPVGLSLCTHGSDLPECQSACTLALCKPRATWSEVGLYLCWIWVICLCLFVFGCVWLCEHALLCESMCCLRCVVGCRRCVGCCVVMNVQKDQNEI